MREMHNTGGKKGGLSASQAKTTCVEMKKPPFER
jgi:hypothetical protein